MINIEDLAKRIKNYFNTSSIEVIIEPHNTYVAYVDSRGVWYCFLCNEGSLTLSVQHEESYTTIGLDKSQKINLILGANEQTEIIYDQNLNVVIDKLYKRWYAQLHKNLIPYRKINHLIDWNLVEALR